MSFNFTNFFTWQNLSILIDILVVWYILYLLLMLIKGTKAVQLAKGLVIIWVADKLLDGLALILLHILLINSYLGRLLGL